MPNGHLTAVFAAFALVILGLPGQARAIVYLDGAFEHPNTLRDSAFSQYDGVGQVRTSTGPNSYLGCTGSAISDRLILTASHCFDSGGNGTIDYSRTQFYYYDSSPLRPEFFANGTVITHPNYFVQRDFAGNMTKLRNDIALIVLDTPLPADVPRYEVYRGGLDRRVMDSFGATLVGFGQHWEEGVFVPNRENAERRVGSNQIIQYDPFANQVGIFLGDNTAKTAKGDSGGPIFLNYRDQLGTHLAIAGVSSTSSPSYFTGTHEGIGASSWYSYVGDFADFIDQYDTLDDVQFSRYWYFKGSNCPPGISCKGGVEDFQPPPASVMPEGADFLDPRFFVAGTTEIPEPSTLLCVCIALMFLGGASRRRRSSAYEA